jgi:hypothetical protein
MYNSKDEIPSLSRTATRISIYTTLCTRGVCLANVFKQIFMDYAQYRGQRLLIYISRVHLEQQLMEVPSLIKSKVSFVWKTSPIWGPKRLD